MIAIETGNRTKRLILYISMLLFLFTGANDLFSQYRMSKPGGLNSWKPAHILPNQLDVPTSVVRTDFTIVMRDGVIIDCLKFVPIDVHPAGGWPTVIMVHGYGDHKETLAEFCRLQAEYGYYTMTYSVRGQGLSGGLSNLMSTLEADDLIEIVDWIKADTSNGSNPDKILIMGGSQGGAVPLIAATRGMQVAAIINSVAPPDFATSWIENGSVKMTLLWTIEYTPDTARYNSQVDRMSDWIYSGSKQHWDSLAYWLPRDRDFVDGLQNITVPVLIEAAWQDKFFNADGWILNIDKITNAPMTSYLGAVRGHGSDISLTEDIWHMNWFNNWYFEWLWGIPTPIMDQAKFQYASTQFPVIDNNYFTFTHDSSATLLRNSTTPLRLYLNNGGSLKTSYRPGSKYAKLRNNVSKNYTLQDAVYSEFKGTDFDKKFKRDSISFITSPLTSSLEWTGTPVIRIDYKSSASTFCQFNYQIYEVLASGEKRFINRANYTDRNYVKNSRREVTFRGHSHSHIFQAGSKIQLVITNLDRAHTDVEFFGTNPFVLPVMENASNYVYLTGNSYIELPVMNQSAAAMNLIFEEEGGLVETDNNNGIPEKFSLSQNYPNPFNPNTLIEYSVAKTQKVELKVFDITGREVQTLVNSVQGPGSYNVMFNASNLSSGVYFYRINAGDFTDIKKMMLVK